MRTLKGGHDMTGKEIGEPRGDGCNSLLVRAGTALRYAGERDMEPGPPDQQRLVYTLVRRSAGRGALLGRQGSHLGPAPGPSVRSSTACSNPSSRPAIADISSHIRLHNCLLVNKVPRSLAKADASPRVYSWALFTRTKTLRSTASTPAWSLCT